MQPTNRPLTPRSRCVYCSSPDYGKGCKHGPHGVHFHADDSRKCSFCGSPDYGKGCKINPTGNLHIHGTSFNAMFRETLQSFLDNEVLLKELKKDFKEFEAYKLQLIDEKGNRIKKPLTDAERAALSPLTKTVLKLKKYLGNKFELLEASVMLEKQTVSGDQDIQKYKKIVEYRERIQESVNEIYKTLDEAGSEGLSLDDIKQVLRA